MNNSPLPISLNTELWSICECWFSDFSQISVGQNKEFYLIRQKLGLSFKYWMLHTYQKIETEWAAIFTLRSSFRLWIEFATTSNHLIPIQSDHEAFVFETIGVLVCKRVFLISKKGPNSKVSNIMRNLRSPPTTNIWMFCFSRKITNR